MQNVKVCRKGVPHGSACKTEGSRFGTTKIPEVGARTLDSHRCLVPGQGLG